MDPDNPIVKLCAEGMEAEAAGEHARAKAMYDGAWADASDDWERCVAAHYVARHQDGPESTLHWNETCLTYAELVGDERVTGFYPSLYLNIGHSHELLGDLTKAEEKYRRAEEHLGALPPGPYADMVGDAVARGLERIKR